MKSTPCFHGIFLGENTIGKLPGYRYAIPGLKEKRQLLSREKVF